MLESFEHQTIGLSSVTAPPREQCSEHIPELYVRAMVDSYSAGVAVLDETGTILYVNRAWREFALPHGFRANLYGVGCNYLEVRSQAADASRAESQALADGINEVLLGHQTEYQREYLTRHSIARRWIRIHAARFDLPRACRVLVTHEDVTPSRETAEARQNEAERLQVLLNVTHIFPWEADGLTSLFTSVGEQAVDMLGYPTEDWCEVDFWPRNLHPDDRDEAIAKTAEYAKTRDNFELEYRMIARDGRTVWLHNLVSVLREGGVPHTIRGFSIDITERKQAEAILRHLTGRLINAQEEERRRVARELHDDLNQRMALFSIELEQLGQLVEEPFDLHNRLENLQTQAQEISTDIHRISYRLHPSKLDHLGVAAAIKSLCQEISGKGKLKVKFEQSGFPANLSNEVALCIFRIAQEALRNCLKHSGAAVAHLQIERTQKGVHLSVSDDGCGFDMDSGANEAGLGFTSMQERLRMVDGRLEIRSQPFHGTVIEVFVPLTHVDTVFLLNSRSGISPQ